MTSPDLHTRIVEAELKRHTLEPGRMCSCGLAVGEDDNAVPEWDAHLAAAVARALAGRLLPDGGETREERGYWNPDTREVQSWWSYHDHGYKAPDRRRTVTTWPDGSTYTSAWEPVSWTP